MERSNRETIARLGEVEVETLPALAVRHIGPQPHLPLERWLGRRDSLPRDSKSRRTAAGNAGTSATLPDQSPFAAY